MSVLFDQKESEKTEGLTPKEVVGIFAIILGFLLFFPLAIAAFVKYLEWIRSWF